MENDLKVRLRRFVVRGDKDFDREDAEVAFQELLDALNRGTVRAAYRTEEGEWRANRWVKEGILLGFRLGRLVSQASGDFPFFDKHTYPLKPMGSVDGVRIVPGGSAVRTGAYLAPGVVCMPPMYVNTGAYVDSDTMIDSHALVGSCAQIGKRVHLSTAAQIGGVIEPIGAVPVVVEDDAFIGGGCGIYEGTIVRRAAVLAPGVILTKAMRLYDIVKERVIAPAPTLEVPEGAVVVPGSRPVTSALGVSLYAPVIVKYRDEKTDAALALESALR